MVLAACPNIDSRESGAWVSMGPCLNRGETLESKILQNRVQREPRTESSEGSRLFSFPKVTYVLSMILVFSMVGSTVTRLTEGGTCI